MKKQTKEQHKPFKKSLKGKNNKTTKEIESIIHKLMINGIRKMDYESGYQQAQKDDKLIIDKLQLALNIEREWSERLKKELLLQKQWSEATVKEAKKRGIKEFYTYPLIIKKIKGDKIR